MNRGRKLVVDVDRCWGCRACETACKQEHGLKGPRAFVEVARVGPTEIDGVLHAAYVPQMCVHCENPACAEACPVGALRVDESGRVYVEPAECIGCGACVSACPYGAIEIDEAAGVAAKCDLCASRMDLGLPPSCLQHCVGRAMALLDDEQLKLVARHKSSWGVGTVVYVSSEWPDLGKGFGKTGER